MKQKNSEKQVQQKQNRIVALETELKHYTKMTTDLEEDKIDMTIRINSLNEEIHTLENDRDKLEDKVIGFYNTPFTHTNTSIFFFFYIFSYV